MGAELFHAHGRTDIMKLIVAFRNFANAPDDKKFIRLNSKAQDTGRLQNVASYAEDCRDDTQDVIMSILYYQDTDDVTY